ncbi:MAG: HPr family phosphocarrier protein [Spirochaetales bacterium]|nr:HPr family phosphocarrier protein [Spirochaetales bacterium]
MIEKVVTVKNRAGIHARPASLIVKTANKYDADLFFEKDEMRINGKSIMGIITLGASYKTEIKIITEGTDEEEAAEAIAQLFINRFENEE